MFQPFRITLLEGVPARAGAVMWLKKEEKRLFLRPCFKGVDLSSEDATISYVQDRHNIASILENIFLYLFQTGGLDQFTRAIHWLVID